MKSVWSILLILLVLQEPAYKAGIVFKFFIYRAEIAKTECEQKEVVDSCCKGTCVLTKEIENTTEERAANPLEFLLKIELSQFIIDRQDVLVFYNSYNPSSSFRYLSSISEKCCIPPYIPPCIS